jgi:acyl dehydratase
MFLLYAVLLVMFLVVISVLLCGFDKVKILGFVFASVLTGSSKGSAKTRRFKSKMLEQQVRFTKKEVEVYKEEAGSTQVGIPGTMPFSKSFWSALDAMTKVVPALPLLGAINMSAEYQTFIRIEADKDYKLLTGVTKFMDGDKGLEVYVSITLLTKTWEKVWEGTIMTLFPKKRRSKSKDDLPTWEEFSIEKFTLESTPTAIRNWASVTQDFNPIHLHDVSAKLFGQKGQICHGMWSMARVLSILEDEFGYCIKQAKVEWKKPFHCGKASQGEYHISKDDTTGEVRLLVLNTKTQKYTMPHLLGTFTLDK